MGTACRSHARRSCWFATARRRPAGGGSTDMRRPRFTRAPTVGIAIGDAGEIAISDGARVRRGSCTNARDADALAAWLGGEREALGYPADTRCVISLVPPLCELRQLTLP